ncbi:MAG: energy-coupling factor transporter transmembrane protein EcfT [Methanobacteriaceae archaeon]|jgi:energy-coupling factor transport system permease protein|nr:energy-coupling factor transporter transmembrane protein EcfT [Methanobacteriaceae archaeon]
MELLTNKSYNSNINIDPRTKILVLIILSFIVFSDAPLYSTLILISIPFFCLFISNHKKAAIIYLILFIFAQISLIYLVPITHGALNTISLTFGNLIARMAPSILMGYYVISTTRVSEFVASMEEIKVPKSIIIPLSVIFRYFPTLFDEIKSIRDAMKMKGIGLNFDSLKSPVTLMEYFFVPVLINAVKTSDELSAASLTRGLSSPKQRTNIAKVGFTYLDIILIFLSLLGLAFYLLYSFGGITIA